MSVPRNPFHLSETSLKRQTRDYLGWLENLGFLWYERLNSGSIVVAQGDRKRKVELCRPGTADFIIIIKGQVVFWETKSRTGKPSPEQREFGEKAFRNGAIYIHGGAIDALVEMLQAINPKISSPEGY